MTDRWLSDGWVAAAAAEASGLTGPPSLTAVVEVEVTGGPDGDVSVHAVFADGHLVASGTGGASTADLTLTLTDADARAVLSGALDPSVAFMQGRMKVAGEMGPLLDLLALAGTAPARELRDRIVQRTAG